MSHQNSNEHPLLEYLLAEGQLTEREFAELSDQAIGKRAPLGQVLVQERFISVHSLMRALEVQSLNPSRRLGEICVEKRYCTEDELEQALQIQENSGPHALILLMSESDRPKEDVLRALGCYLTGLERREVEMSEEIERLRSELELLRGEHTNDSAA